VGVKVILAVAFVTDAVYVLVPLANVGDKVPFDIVIADNVATFDAGAERVTVVV
jgi:hypothetical protein